jgi:uncharacterized membrane-anchored protein YitT (DUF2179 family)
MMKHITRIIAASTAPAFIIFTFRQSTADHYLDAGTGSIIIQALIGGLVGGLFALKIFWGRISTFFKNLFSRGEKA